MLSETARTILGLIAEGRSYDQILQQHPDLTYFDIFGAAREALELAQTTLPKLPLEDVPTGNHVSASDDESGQPAPAERRPSYIERARATHRRAWARWTQDEDTRLTALFQRGESRAVMEQELGRQPGAIRSRLLRLGLIAEDDDGASPSDRARAGGASIEPSMPIPSPREPAPPAVPGWELFRDRLIDESRAP